MDLKKRLASLDRLTRKPLEAPPTGHSSDLDHGELAVRELGLERLDTPHGVIYLRDLRDPLPAPVAPLPGLHGLLSQQPGQTRHPEEILFLDTETTGLAGGTGTLVFLVGVSWWEGDEFCTRQYFLCGPAGEPALLGNLHELAGGFKAVATFNGAAFDLPLLRTRSLLNRLGAPWDDLAGWDLLVPARRLWKRGLADCRQQTIEHHVCGLSRQEQDLPGNLIPQTWFDFLQQGQTEQLARVLYHNHADMLGLGHIFRAMVDLAGNLENPAQPAELSWQQSWALGLAAERRRQPALAEAWMLRAWEDSSRSSSLRGEDPRLVADALRILKRAGDWPLVERIILRALSAGVDDWWLHREAAILYEHRLVDLERACRHALVTGDEHRLARVQLKLQQMGKERN